MTRERVASELLKVREQIEKLKEREKHLQSQKKEMDEMEILKVTKRIGITPEQLYLLNALNEKEIAQFLKERERDMKNNQEEKETDGNEKM